MPNPSYRFINLDYMDLMTDGDVSMKKLMLEMLFEEIPKEIQKMGPLYADENYEELRQVSHKMKSTLSFVGNKEMTVANQTIEHNAKNRTDLQSIPSLLKTLEALYPKVISELQEEHKECSS